MAPTRETCLKAGSELADIAVLASDDIPNKDQVAQFALEGFQAVQAVAAIGVPSEKRPAVLSNISEGFINKINMTIYKLD